ncbi:Ribosomal large subunit pseudouridine synthase D [hydrothermal vent metagenome]|uniref:Ribosomal large subunit pseudouridine synthase D n=1 Tax=hydrothermal vent metagenome TaxID=652676 RepID=A0A3B0QVU5_9ZZZZ
METKEKITVTAEDNGMRLDTFLSHKLEGTSRTFIKELIKKSLVTVNELPAKPSHHLKDGDQLDITIPEPEAPGVEAEDIPLNILFEDKDVIVIDKARGMVTHPGAGRTSETFVNALLHHTKDLSSVGGPLRPGIVHRLDKDTSGVMMAAKNNAAHHALSEQFKEHTTKRRYHALVWGRIKDDKGRIEIGLGRDLADRKKISPRTGKARKAISNYKVLKRFDYFTLVEVSPETGRTHQIRVHMTEINHPIVGDPTYGSRTPPSGLGTEARAVLKKIRGQLLHAYSLGFTHPTTKEYIEFTAPYPDIMVRFIRLIDHGEITS